MGELFGLFIFIFIIVLFVILKSVKQINEYERGILFSFGKYTKILEPGWTIVLPIVQSYYERPLLGHLL